MREENGNVIANAHIIGTLRRILKLLFYQIKPIFVFDGDTPLLKKQTVRKRRKFREREEDNYTKAAHKIILAQLKKDILSASASEPSLSTSNIIPSSSSSGSSASSKSNLNAASSSQVNWEDNYNSESNKVEYTNTNDEEEYSFSLPEDSCDINIEFLSELPSDLRKGIVEDARRKERQKKRNNYIPVAENPSLYSQTQFANFLRTRYN